MKRVLALLCAVALMLGSAVSVSAATSAKLIPTNIPKAFPTIKQDPSFTIVEFWHAMGGDGPTMVNICNWYNSTLGKKIKAYVKPIYQGSYDAITIKLQATLQSGIIKSLPDIVQLSTQGGFSVRDSKYIQYAEDLIQADPTFKIKDKLDPCSLYYASYKGKQLAMPLANSVIVQYYNKDAFKAVGLDPEKPPKTLAEYTEYCKKLVIPGKGKLPVRYGGNCRPYTFQFTTWISRQKNGTARQMDKDDGKLGTPTKLICAEDGTLKATLTEWTKATQSGAVNYNSNSNSLLINGQSCMFSGSITGHSDIVTAISSLKDKSKQFELGLGILPVVNADDVTAEAAGGNALYMFNKGDSVKVKKAWDFLKFLCTVDVSAYWYVQSGYFPINSDAINTKYVQDELNAVPSKRVPLKIRSDSAKYYKMTEPWMPQQATYSNLIGDQCVLLAQGKTTVDKCVTYMAKKVKSLLDTYNSVNN